MWYRIYYLIIEINNDNFFLSHYINTEILSAASAFAVNEKEMVCGIVTFDCVVIERNKTKEQ